MNAQITYKHRCIYIYGDVFACEKSILEMGFRYDPEDMRFYKFSYEPDLDIENIYTILRFRTLSY